MYLAYKFSLFFFATLLDCFFFVFIIKMADNGNGEALIEAEGEKEVKQEVKTEEEEEEQKPQVPQFTKEQMERIVMCRTVEDEIVEAPWYLMAQSKTFMQMWGNLELEQKPANGLTDLIFPLNEITTDCFLKILEWMREHHNVPEPILKEDPVSHERIWFKFTDWERQFFDVDFERVKEYFLASNFLDIRSLYLYCAQECARCIMDKSAEEIREMLCLEDDLTDEEKARITKEYDVPPDFPIIPLPDTSDMPGTSGTSSSGTSSQGTSSQSSSSQPSTNGMPKTNGDGKSADGSGGAGGSCLS